MAADEKAIPSSCPRCGAAVRESLGSIDGGLHVTFSCRTKWHGWLDGSAGQLQRGLCFLPADEQAEMQKRLWQPLSAAGGAEAERTDEGLGSDV